MGAQNRARLSSTGRRVTTRARTTRHGQPSGPCVPDLIKASLCVIEHFCCLTGGVCKAERRHRFGESVFVKRCAVNLPLGASQCLKSAVGIV